MNLHLHIFINPHANIFTNLVINEENDLETFSPQNPLAKVFYPNVLRNQNPSDLALPKNNCDVYFPPFKPISTALNPDAMSFIPKHGLSCYFYYTSD